MSEDERVLRAAVACSLAPSAETVIAAIAPAASRLGFAYFAVYEAMSDGERVDLRPIMGFHHTAWQAHYRETNLAASDLRFRLAARSSRDFFCSEILLEDPNVTPGERAVFEQAKAFGIGDSYVLPYRTAGGRTFCAVFIGEGHPLTPHLRVALRTLSHEILLAALRLRAELQGRTRAQAFRLTPRELQSLALIRDGKSSAEIASRLGISVRTVDHYVANLCRKMGVRSRSQAVAKAVSLELIAHYQS